MVKFSATKHDKNMWEIWQHDDAGQKLVCYMTAENILELFNEVVPMTIDEPYLIGDINCKHSWRPWKFNDKFMICNKCPAMKKIKKLVPRQYRD